MKKKALIKAFEGRLLLEMHESHPFWQVINFLLHTEIIPLCLRIMENGSELSKTVATFIVSWPNRASQHL